MPTVGIERLRNEERNMKRVEIVEVLRGGLTERWRSEGSRGSGFETAFDGEEGSDVHLA